MFAPRVLQLFVFEHGKSPRDAAAAVAGHDNVINIPAACGDKRIGLFLALFFGPFF